MVKNKRITSMVLAATLVFATVGFGTVNAYATSPDDPDYWHDGVPLEQTVSETDFNKKAIDALKSKIALAANDNGVVEITDMDSISKEVMETLKANPGVTLYLKINDEGTERCIVIPGSAATTDDLNDSDTCGIDWLLAHYIDANNPPQIVKAQAGDTFASIAKRIGVEEWYLRICNPGVTEINENTVLANPKPTPKPTPRSDDKQNPSKLNDEETAELIKRFEEAQKKADMGQADIKFEKRDEDIKKNPDKDTFKSEIPSKSIIAGSEGSGAFVDLKAHKMTTRDSVNQSFLAQSFALLEGKKANILLEYSVYNAEPAIQSGEKKNIILSNVPANPGDNLYAIGYNNEDGAYLMKGVVDLNKNVTLADFRMRGNSNITLFTQK